MGHFPCSAKNKHQSPLLFSSHTLLFIGAPKTKKTFSYKNNRRHTFKLPKIPNYFHHEAFRTQFEFTS